MLAVLQELVFDSLPDGAVWPFDRTYVRPRHFHGQLEALLVTCGTAMVHLGTRAIRVRSGQLCWVLPGVPHVMSDFSADFDMWVVQLNSTMVERGWRHATGQTGPRELSLPFASWSLPLGELLSGRAIVDVAGGELRQMSELAASVWTTPDRAQASAGLD